ncbi:hypothetical protein ABFT80_14290 [Mesorhizobium sp. SB112]|uniref:hypothetical protein n=1 Tax=Mesorhizobium sp. SB112 TaxID=3151853 RepID=UPI003266E68E
MPAFVLPSKDGDPISALLETVHRDGGTYGGPGAMLSAGNLNTAALTLFLALHLSVNPDLPWLVLDDPVQSMDELHVAQFAALLRTLAKREDRQIVIAIHERQLFDYLTLELSPAFPGDKLITVRSTSRPKARPNIRQTCLASSPTDWSPEPADPGGGQSGKRRLEVFLTVETGTIERPHRPGWWEDQAADRQ